MTAINSDNRTAWQALADAARAQFPSEGKRVRITSGKHTGKTGAVTLHARSKFYSTRYKTPAMLHLMDINGREGFYVRVITNEGETFTVDAEHTEVIE